MAFPFGYGLSYTTFEYSNFTVEDKGDTFEVGVDVTNTGDVDGKHTVQIYFQSPYTQYDIDNQVEKAAVELCGFDKKMVAAGDTEHYTITVNRRLTSYDANNAKTYILEDGDYYFTVGTDAHKRHQQYPGRQGRRYHPHERRGGRQPGLQTEQPHLRQDHLRGFLRHRQCHHQPV